MKSVDILGNEIEFDCLGCDIANHKLIPPGGYVYEDGFINVSADPEIPIPGFMVLGISKHVKSMNELSKEERVSIMEVLNRTIQIIKKVQISKEVLIVQEERAGHFHIWIVPIYGWMEKYGKSVVNIKEIIDYSKNNFNENVKEELINAVEKIRREFEV